MKKDPLAFIKHIRDAINSIEDFTKRLSKDGFLNNQEKQYAVTRALEIIGEAAKNVPQSFREKHANIPWKEIAGTRDKLIHLYFGVNLDLIWKVIKEDLPKLKKQIEEILKQEKK